MSHYKMRSFRTAACVPLRDLAVQIFLQIPTTDVIVEDHLGEGAFGLVFKGTVRGPLRNPKLTAKVRQAIGLPVAIKLLKGELRTMVHIE